MGSYEASFDILSCRADNSVRSDFHLLDSIRRAVGRYKLTESSIVLHDCIGQASKKLAVRTVDGVRKDEVCDGPLPEWHVLVEVCLQITGIDSLVDYEH